MRFAEAGIVELQKVVDTLLVIPNQNLFRVANEKTTFADAFAMADQVLYSGVACITDLMVKEGLINLDFADVRAVMREMGKAMMGTGEASGEKRALTAAEAAIANPLIDDASMKGARGLLISITGGKDLTLYEVDEAATRIREEVDQDANIIVGATFDESLEGIIRVSVVATGIDHANAPPPSPAAKARSRNSPARCATIASASPTASSARRRRAGTASAAAVESAAHAAVAAAAPAAIGQRRSLDPPDADEAVAVRAGAARRRRPSCRCRRPSSRRRPNARRAQPRMPRIDELPLPAQNEMRAQRGELADEDHPEKRRMSLMQRLASVGLGRKPEEAEAPPAPRTARPMPQFERPPQRPTARQPEGRHPEPAPATTRCRNMPAVPRRRGSTPMAGRRLCIIRPRKTSSTSRPSCAGRPTDGPANPETAPLRPGAGRFCSPSCLIDLCLSVLN